ncbi:hypothetical protein OG196_31850 [Kitasatospora purpeofusca]|uniref:hypothetical protein n=1 Tax=Kitasatospora purpeofusca TaxID=67352 RepID=UPI002E163A51|nr:hypothetical protein OG196_31850 [Kitasatospora purpeofusca]
MARLELSANLAERLAPLVARHAERLAEEVAAEARQLAPPAKTWHVVEDGQARHSHQEADGQTLPGPVPFKVGEALLSGPRDPDGPVKETAGCRCTVTEDPSAVAKSISAGKAAIRGSRVQVDVVCDFPKAADAEFAQGEGSHFMSRAAAQVAARHR